MNRNRPRSGTREEAESKPILGVIESVQTETERVMSPDMAGGAPTRVTHPYVSLRSWRRVMPEEQTAAVMVQRGDTSESEISYYFSGAPEKRIGKYREGVGYYRPLDRGEWEDTSFGLAQVYGSRHGALDQRGGIVRQWLDNTNLDHGSKAPTFHRQLHDHNHNTIRGEERFGVVWRKGANFTERVYPKVGGAFAREYVRSLSFSGQPGVLVDIREGHVFESNSLRAVGPAGKFLRRRALYGTTSGTNNVDMTDEDGNNWSISSDTATAGRVFDVPAGPFRVTAGDDVKFTSRRDILMSGVNMVVRTSSVIHIEADVAIKLVSKGMISIEASTVQVNGRIVAANSSPF